MPAGPALYDIYDEQLLHHRRYDRAALMAQARTAGFVVRRATHLGALLYPAFRVVKKRNKRLLSRPPEEKRRIVAGQIRRTSASLPVKWLLRLELALGRWLAYPFGVRCIVVLQKPAR